MKKYKKISFITKCLSEKENTMNSDIFIEKFDKEKLRFVDKEGKEYRVGKIIKKKYNINESEEGAIIDAVILLRKLIMMYQYVHYIFKK